MFTEIATLAILALIIALALVTLSASFVVAFKSLRYWRSIK